MDSEKDSSDISSVDQEKIGLVTPRNIPKIVSPRSPSVVQMSCNFRSGMKITRSPKYKPAGDGRLSRIDRVQKHDRAQDILDNVLLRITALRENPDAMLTGNLGTLPSSLGDFDDEEEDEDEDEEEGDIGFDPYVEAARHMDEIEENACCQDKMITELKNELTMQRFQTESEIQKKKLELEQLTLSEKIQAEEAETLRSKISELKDALKMAEENLKKVKGANVELHEQMQKFKLENKSLLERLRISDQDKRHVEALCKSTADMMELELAALRVKLKTQITKLNQEEETCNVLRSEVRNKSLDVQWLQTEKANMKTKLEALQCQLKNFKTVEKKLEEFRAKNRKLRLEIEGLLSTKESLTQRLEMEKQLTEDMEKRMMLQRARKEQTSQSKENLLNKYETMDQKLKIERLELQVGKLKEDLDLGEKKISELNSLLHASEENVMKSQLERDEVIMAMKREQTSLQFALEASKNTSIREFERKLQHANSAKSVLEAKLSALKSELTVLEESKAKTLDIQKSTIANLERELTDTQAKLQKATEAQREQNELASTLEMERRKFEEEQFGLKMRLKAVDNELEQNATLHVDVKSLEEKLKVLNSKNSRLELEKSQVEIKLQSMEERVGLVQEQRVRSLGIQRETISLLEEQLKTTRKQHQGFKEKKQAFENQVKSLENENESLKRQIENLEHEVSSRSTVKADIPDSTKQKDTNVGKEAEVVYYQKMLDKEKKVSTRLAASVKDLTLKNKKGGKALTILLKSKKHLEARLKKMDRLRQHMCKLSQKYVYALERELKRFEQRKENNLSPSERDKIEQEVLKLKARLEAERKTLQELSMVGSQKSPMRMKSEFGVERFKISRAKSTITSPAYREQGIKELWERLHVTNDLSRLEQILDRLRNDNLDTPEEWHQLQSINDELQQIAERVRSAKDELGFSLNKFHSIKLEMGEKLRLLKVQSDLSHKLESKAKSTKNNELEEKPNKTQGTKISEELQLPTQRSGAEVTLIVRQIVQIEGTIQQLRNASAKAMSVELQISSLLSSSKNLLRIGRQRGRQEKVWHLPVAHGHQYKKSNYEDKASKRVKAICSHCKARNTVNNFSTTSNFQVNCWMCNKFFQVEQTQDLSSPRSIRTDITALDRSLPHGSSSGKPKLKRSISSPALIQHAPKLSQSSGGVHPEASTGFFEKVKVSGLPRSMVQTPQLLNAFCNVVFQGYEITSKESTSTGDVVITLISTVTSKQILELQSTIYSLRAAMQSKPYYDGDIDKVTIKGISSEKSTIQTNVGALTSPKVLQAPSPNLVRAASCISLNLKKQHESSYV